MVSSDLASAAAAGLSSSDDLTEGERHLRLVDGLSRRHRNGGRAIRDMEPKPLTAAVEAMREAVEAALGDSASSATSNAFGRVVGEASAAANAAARNSSLCAGGLDFFELGIQEEKGFFFFF